MELRKAATAVVQGRQPIRQARAKSSGASSGTIFMGLISNIADNCAGVGLLAGKCWSVVRVRGH